MANPKLDLLAQHIRDVPDFPKPGILFKDITPMLGNAEAFEACIDLFAEEAAKSQPTKILGIDARGFIFGAAVARHLGVGFVPIRKKGKLPRQTVEASYALEYGEATIAMHTDAIVAGEAVVLIDDLLATGGTAEAAAKLVNQLGGDLKSILFLVELDFLNGREKLAPIPVTSFIHV